MAPQATRGKKKTTTTTKNKIKDLTFLFVFLSFFFLLVNVHPQTVQLGYHICVVSDVTGKP